MAGWLNHVHTIHCPMLYDNNDYDNGVDDKTSDSDVSDDDSSDGHWLRFISKDLSVSQIHALNII